MKMPKIAHKKLSARQKETEEVSFETEYQLLSCQSIYGAVFSLFNNESELRTSLVLGETKNLSLCCLCFTLLVRICSGRNCFFQ